MRAPKSIADQYNVSKRYLENDGNQYQAPAKRADQILLFIVH